MAKGNIFSAHQLMALATLAVFSGATSFTLMDKKTLAFSSQQNKAEPMQSLTRRTSARVLVQ